MKRLALLFSVLYSFSALAQAGYEIKVTLRPFKNRFVYLGHYFGKQYPIIDSAMLNDKSEAIFKGTTRLPGGIYLVGYPDKAGFFEILIDKQQRFSLVTDTATISKGAQFSNSSDNVLFNSYQQYMSAKGREIYEDQQKYKASKNAADSAHWKEELEKLDKTVRDYRENLIKNNPGNILTALLVAM